MRHNIDIALLRAFVAVAETGGMTNASRLLNVTQAAVSQQIKRLEDFLGRELMHRDQRRMELTPTGERLLAYANRMLALNDEMWGVMTSPDFEGEVRFGVPHDLVAAFIPPILKSFNQSWPRVRIAMTSSTTPKLLAQLDAGDIDLTLTTETARGAADEFLMPDQLVWVGAKNGDAHKRRPLPISFGNDTCAFRAATIKALAGAGLDWRLTCDTTDFNPYCAIIEADLAVAPMLTLTAPKNLVVLGKETGLPPLPTYYINLRLPRSGATEIAQELGRFIRGGFASRVAAA